MPFLVDECPQADACSRPTADRVVCGGRSADKLFGGDGIALLKSIAPSSAAFANPCSITNVQATTRKPSTRPARIVRFMEPPVFASVEPSPDLERIHEGCEPIPLDFLQNLNHFQRIVLSS